MPDKLVLDKQVCCLLVDDRSMIRGVHKPDDPFWVSSINKYTTVTVTLAMVAKILKMVEPCERSEILSLLSEQSPS